MELREGIFAVKLCELERQYGLLQTRLELCQGADHDRLRQILQDAMNDYREKNAPAAGKAGGGMPVPGGGGAGLRPAGLHPPDGGDPAGQTTPADAREEDPREEQAEAAALYAEYAIDFASQAMRSAWWRP